MYAFKLLPYKNILQI